MSAIVYTGMRRYSKARSKAIRRYRRKVLNGWYCILAIGCLFVLNWIYQTIRKPGELLSPISSSFAKSPQATWQNYAPLFEKYSTAVVSAELLAALAQVEANGNPVALTYWRWKWSWYPWEIYRPASTALGMFQLTDGTFAEARKYCIRDHQVLSEGPWYDPDSCWLNRFYNRNIPSHAVEMTAAYLHRNVVAILGSRLGKATADQKERLAAVIHLCGVKHAQSFAKRGFRMTETERCGTHSVQTYISQVNAMKDRFHRLRQSGVS
jgi:hypothetical protein